MPEITEIQKFYENSTIFLTGGTGFLGKITVEKLLRSCNVRKIILLMRAKRGMEIEERFEKYFDSPMFENLARQKPSFKEKVVIVSGDLRQANLGLSPKDAEAMMREVEVVFHWAASLNFTEDIKAATEINVKSVRDLLVMSKNMPKLKSLLYVSTAYSHCLRSEIQEVFYEDTLEGKKLITVMDCLEAKTANNITQGFLGEWPNSYVYTKAAAENLIKTEAGDLPVGILRPSIVSASYAEPLPGWVDNLYGYTGLAIAGALGYFRVVCSEPDKKVNLIPADDVVNCGIVAAWQINTNKPNVPIYNCVAFPENTQREVIELTDKYASQIPSTHAIWHHFLIIVHNRTLFAILDYILHYLPSRFADFLFVCIKRKPRFLKIYNKIHKMSDSLIFFTTREWSFTRDNTTNLFNSLSEKDKEIFNFHREIKNFKKFREEYAKIYTLGARLYLLKEPLETVQEGMRKIQMLMYAHYALVSFLLYLFGSLIYQLLK